MYSILAVLWLLVTPQAVPLTETELKIKIAIAIASPVAPVTPATPDVETPDVVTPVSPSTPITPTTPRKLKWEAYASAWSQATTDRKPLVIVIGAAWCTGCVELVKEMETAEAADAHYVKLDLDADVELCRLISHSSTIPQVVIYRKTDTEWIVKRFTGKESLPKIKTALEISSLARDVENFSSSVSKFQENVSSLRSSLPTSSSPKQPLPAKTSGSTTYSWRIDRVPVPAGYEFVNINGDAYYHVTTGDHGAYIRAVTSKVDIRGMNRRDLLSLHSLIHSGLPVGYWQGTCFVFTLP